LPKLERTIRKFGFARLRATGAANYRAIQLAVAITNAHQGLLKLEVSTGTTETTDFYVPTAPDAKREARTRRLNSVDITVSRISQ
jgi:hypothetical protein